MAGSAAPILYLPRAAQRERRRFARSSPLDQRLHFGSDAGPYGRKREKLDAVLICGNTLARTTVQYGTVKHSAARFRDAGSFIAGILIGLAIMTPVFALTVTNLTDWQMLLLLGAPVFLGLGIALQVVITMRVRHLPIISMAPGWHAVR